MSRTGIIIILGLAMALGVFVFLRPSLETQEASGIADAPSPGAAKNSTEPSRTTSSSRSTPSVAETSQASSELVKLPGRGALRHGAVSGTPSFDAAHAQTFSDPVFAGTQWKIWNGVTAIGKGHGRPAGKVLGEVNGFYLVEDGVTSSAQSFDPSRPLVVLSQDGTRAGVVTGIFNVVLEEGASADFLTQSSQFKVVDSYPESQIYFVTSSQVPFNLGELQEALRDAPEVRQLQMDIMDRQYEKF